MVPEPAKKSRIMDVGAVDISMINFNSLTGFGYEKIFCFPIIAAKSVLPVLVLPNRSSNKMLLGF